jgi:hypothetical protein
MNFLSDQDFQDTIYKAFYLHQTKAIASVNQFSFATLFLTSDAKKATRTFVKIFKKSEKKVVDNTIRFIAVLRKEDELNFMNLYYLIK